MIGGQTLPRWLKTHGLPSLCEHAEVSLDPSETDFVRELSPFVVWAGRYPIPTQIKKVELPKIVLATDLATFRALFSRLEKRAEEARKR